MSIGIALLGAGGFAQQEHLPAIAACKKFTLKAVYSRSQKSAEALATQAAADGAAAVQTYFDEPAVEGRALADLLARADIAAVATCIPIPMQPAAVRAALAAGKHVLSEKPVAASVSLARTLLAEYRALPAAPARPIWAVAENYRFYPSLQLAAEKLRGLGGGLVSFNVVCNNFVRPDRRAYNTPWRKNPAYQGGFLLDGGIHYIAALRTLLAAAGGAKAVTAPEAATASNRVATVAGTMAQLSPILPPADTLHSIAVTEGGVGGTVTISFATEFSPPAAITVSTTEGLVTWRPLSVTVVARSPSDPLQSTETTIDCSPANPAYAEAESSGVKGEFAAFAESIAAGKNTVDPRQSPEEAFEDLLLLEAVFDSAAGGSQLAVPRP